MSYTNTTSHYGLPQYVGSDKPKYLTDFNETMATIDGQMYDNATAAATADSKADAAQDTADAATSSITTLDNQINGDSGLAADVAANQGAITTINSLIGNGTPTTTDQTIIGAINELHSDQGNLATLTTTDKSSLVEAVNEVNDKIERGSVSVTATGQTYKELLDNLYALIDTSKVTPHSKMLFETTASRDIFNVAHVEATKIYCNKLGHENIQWATLAESTSKFTIGAFSSSGTWTYSDDSSNTLTGANFIFVY